MSSNYNTQIDDISEIQNYGTHRMLQMSTNLFQYKQNNPENQTTNIIAALGAFVACVTLFLFIMVGLLAFRVYQQGKKYADVSRDKRLKYEAKDDFEQIEKDKEAQRYRQNNQPVDNSNRQSFKKNQDDEELKAEQIDFEIDNTNAQLANGQQSPIKQSQRPITGTGVGGVKFQLMLQRKMQQQQQMQRSNEQKPKNPNGPSAVAADVSYSEEYNEDEVDHDNFEVIEEARNVENKQRMSDKQASSQPIIKTDSPNNHKIQIHQPKIEEQKDDDSLDNQYFSEDKKEKYSSKENNKKVIDKKPEGADDYMEESYYDEENDENDQQTEAIQDKSHIDASQQKIAQNIIDNKPIQVQRKKNSGNQF